MSKHTPGPWTAHHLAVVINAPADKILEIAIARHFPGFTTIGEAKANARLIAAAPDLLMALHYARGFVEAHEEQFGRTETGDFIRAAIAKANSQGFDRRELLEDGAIDRLDDPIITAKAEG